jgi:hypothetical protein
MLDRRYTEDGVERLDWLPTFYARRRGGQHRVSDRVRTRIERYHVEPKGRKRKRKSALGGSDIKHMGPRPKLTCGCERVRHFDYPLVDVTNHDLILPMLGNHRFVEPESSLCDIPSGTNCPVEEVSDTRPEKVSIAIDELERRPVEQASQRAPPQTMPQ